MKIIAFIFLLFPCLAYCQTDTSTTAKIQYQIDSLQSFRDATKAKINLTNANMPEGKNYYDIIRKADDQIAHLKTIDKYFALSKQPYNYNIQEAGICLQNSIVYSYCAAGIIIVGALIFPRHHTTGMIIELGGVIEQIAAYYQIYKAGKLLEETTGLGKQ
jgi:hypothetical protein